MLMPAGRSLRSSAVVILQEYLRFVLILGGCFYL